MERFSALLDHLWGESTSYRWFPLTKASDAELCGFIWSAPEHYGATVNSLTCYTTLLRILGVKMCSNVLMHCSTSINQIILNKDLFTLVFSIGDTYISSTQCSGFSIRYPFLTWVITCLGAIPGYGLAPGTKIPLLWGIYFTKHKDTFALPKFLIEMAQAFKILYRERQDPFIVSQYHPEMFKFTTSDSLKHRGGWTKGPPLYTHCLQMLFRGRKNLFWLQFHCSLFLRVQLIISQRWFN